MTIQKAQIQIEYTEIDTLELKLADLAAAWAYTQNPAVIKQYHDAYHQLRALVGAVCSTPKPNSPTNSCPKIIWIG
jgi:hypothetical protein